MKIFRFVKVFFVVSTILSNFRNATRLNCISMKNQECKRRPQVVNVNSNNPILKQVNVMVIVIILTIHIQKFVFLML